MSVYDSAPARAPVYGPIHKVHRFALASAVARVGAADYADKDEALEVAGLVRQQIAMGRAHLRNEDRHIHPLLRSGSIAHVAELDTAHDEHERDFAALEALAKRIEQGSSAERIAAGRELYLEFARFVARDFEHMDFEERVVEPAIHASHSDAQIEAAHRAVVAETSADELQALGELASQALSPPELEKVAELLKSGQSADDPIAAQPEAAAAT